MWVDFCFDCQRIHARIGGQGSSQHSDAFDYKTKIAATNRYIFVTADSMLTTKTRFWYWFLKLYSFVFNLHLIKLHREALHLVTFHQTIIMKPGTIFYIPSINF